MQAHIVFLLLLVTTNLVDGFAASNIVFRKGQKKDQLKIATALAKELMNPLGVKIDRFVVATDSGGSVIGWAQVKPLGQTAERDPSEYNARPGSYDLEKDVDDQMLDEFENDDSIQVPVGMASLPWTKEYRAMEAAVQKRNQRRDEIRAETELEAQSLDLWELSSVFVEAPYRGQGIGTELVRRVLKQRFESGTIPTTIYLLTLATTVDWYKDNFGFEEITGSDIPSSMAFEVTAGNLITTFIGAKLCCMRATSKTVELCN